MAAKRFYYGENISVFLKRKPAELIGTLALASGRDDNGQTKRSWLAETEVLQASLAGFRGRGSVFFEYSIPRMGRRADVIAVIDTVIFVLEFKTEEQKFTREALIQVWDYALDLKNFQLGTRDRTVVPILVVPGEKDSRCSETLTPFEDLVYKPLQTNADRLSGCISNIIEQLRPEAKASPEEDLAWARSGYEPTPTIIEAAIALYEENTVEDITKHTGDIVATGLCLDRIIDDCRSRSRKAICFVTGVPGAGKTLIGLQTAIEQFKKGEKAVYLSGNYPLVEVLQEALTRDYVRRAKLEYAAGITDEKPCTKAEAKSKVKAFIQMIHHYRDLYLEGTEVKDGKIIPIPEYFRGHQDKAYIPAEHIAIFDEAQRAWTKEELARFMREKKGLADFPFSEPEYLISCMDRQPDWGVVICLIGGGQEINKGEAGMTEWISSLNRRYCSWDVYMSDRLTEREYAGGRAGQTVEPQERLRIEPSLHLSASMRSFRAEKVSLFVHQLLELKKDEAAATFRDLKNYPIVLTRSLDTAKAWLREKARGSERFGLLASSKAERLKAESINVRYQPDFVHWFLDGEHDIRSSNSLEDTLTEFKVQGLEIDWACVAWDADLRLDPAHSKWCHYQLRSGSCWQRINKPIRQEYQINAYRVLLTRARQGMVIFVPAGDTDGNPPDETRNPIWYDGIAGYLKEIGIPEI